MWEKINKNIYIYRIENASVIGMIKKEDNNWQCYVFYNFGVYIYTDPCRFKKHAMEMIEMRFGEKPWTPKRWLRYRIAGHWMKYTKKDKHCWMHNWTYATKADAINHPQNVSYFVPFNPTKETMEFGFSFKEVK